MDILYGEGISRDGEILDLAVEHELIKKSGAFYSYEGERIGQGRDNARRYLKEHPELFEELEKQLRSELLANPDEVPMDSVEAEDDEDDLDTDEFEL